MSFQRITILKSNNLSLNKQKGVVIVVALFIVALAATMAYVMMGRLERDTRRSLLLQRDTQAAYYAQGSIIWAMDQLRNNLEKQRPNKLVDRLPIKSPVTTLNNYRISSVIYDAQDRYNINNLSGSQGQRLADFQRVLRVIVPDVSEEQANALMSTIYDWIMPLTAADSVLNKYYFNLPMPYRAAHRPMLALGEMNLIKGMSPRIVAALKPYVIALPGNNVLINVMTASAPVLMMLSPSLTLADAKKIIQVRDHTNIASVEAFLNLPAVKKFNLSKEKLTIKSDYFLVETEVAIENQRTLLYTLLKREGDANNAKVTIEWQSKNTY